MWGLKTAMMCSRSRCAPRAVVVAAAVLLIFCIVPARGQSPSSSSCGTMYALPNGTERTYSQCRPLAVQGATLAWNYYPGANSSGTGSGSGAGSATGGVLDLAYTNSLPSSGGWVGWGLNPVSSSSMVGASVLVAFMDSSSGGAATVLPYKLNADLLSGSPLLTGTTDLDVLDKSVDIDTGTRVATIFARLRLPPGSTTLNHIWNKGPSVSNQSPAAHSTSRDYLTGLGAVDVSTGAVIAGRAKSPTKENIHGVLNAISWGFLLPVGIMISRYMRPFKVLDPTWFYLHIVCQTCGYIIGIAGWSLGWKILNRATESHSHKNIGISLFVLATVQIAALVVRPSLAHKWRKFWNVYHHALGYTVIILGIVNVFKGFHLLQPAKGWKHAYIGIISALGAIALVAEVATWRVWLTRRSRTPPKRLEDGHGSYSANGSMTAMTGSSGKLEDRPL